MFFQFSHYYSLEALLQFLLHLLQIVFCDHHHLQSVVKTKIENSKTRYVALTKLSLGVSERLDYFLVADM